MHEPNEIVVIELSPEGRMRLSGQIYSRMEELRLIPFRYDALDLGFHLPADWPDNPAVEITMAQPVVLMQRLEMRLTISELNAAPMPAATNPKPILKSED